MRSAQNANTNGTAMKQPFRFSLRELLVVTVVLAVSLTWPVLFLYTIPLLGAAAVSRAGFGSMIPMVCATALSPVLGASMSKYYWNYSFWPPAMLPGIRSLEVVEQLTSVGSLNPKQVQPGFLAVKILPSVDGLQWNTDTELMPTDRILQSLIRREISITSSEPIPATMMNAIWNDVNDVGFLLDGAPERPNTKTLNGYVGIGKTGGGDRILFATVMGDEYTNDHFPYYELVYQIGERDLKRQDFQWFFVDIAGIEGMTWFSVAVPLFLLMFCPALTACFFWRPIIARGWHKPVLYLWASPATLLGLSLIPIARLQGGSCCVVQGVVEAHGGIITKLLRRGLPWVGSGAAVTLGHVVWGCDEVCLELTRRHERVHVAQYERWGPFFIPLYLLFTLIIYCRGGRPYLDNPFELEAFRTTSD
jgi:hypothetical protein